MHPKLLLQPGVELWNGGMMPFITIISFAKWGSSPQLPTLTWDQYQSLVSVSSPDWNMMQVSPHGCGGATSSTQHVVYSVVARRGAVVSYHFYCNTLFCNILIYSVRVRWNFFIGVLEMKFTLRWWWDAYLSYRGESNLSTRYMVILSVLSILHIISTIYVFVVICHKTCPMSFIYCISTYLCFWGW